MKEAHSGHCFEGLLDPKEDFVRQIYQAKEKELGQKLLELRTHFEERLGKLLVEQNKMRLEMVQIYQDQLNILSLRNKPSLSKVS